jgi:hypothetical protein
VNGADRLLVKGLLQWGDYHRSRRSHIVIETHDRREQFALFGGFRARHRFRGLYLSASSPWRTRLVLHRPATAGYCRNLAQRFGLVVFCGDSAPTDLASELLTIPLCVDMDMQTPTVLEGPGAPWSRSAKANIAKVRRGGFTFDIVNSSRSVSDFHRTMFRPSMRSRHGAGASLDTERALVRHARTAGGELLRVFQNGRWVAGVVTESTPIGYRLLKLGWLAGGESLLKSGVVSAIYWFGIQRAAALGHKRVLLGSVYPFLENGVLRYKSHWGAGFSGDSRQFSDFHLLLEPSHRACRRFLQAHSLVTVGAGGDYVVFSGHCPYVGDIAPAVLSAIKRWYVWRDQALTVPEAASEEVPSPLRPWVTCLGSPVLSGTVPLQRPLNASRHHSHVR